MYIYKHTLKKLYDIPQIFGRVIQNTYASLADQNFSFYNLQLLEYKTHNVVKNNLHCKCSNIKDTSGNVTKEPLWRKPQRSFGNLIQYKLW